LVDNGESITEINRFSTGYKALEVAYIQSFVIKYNTFEWSNGADFAPEYLYEFGM